MSTTPIRDTRRKEIIAAALDLFSRKGYRGTTMPDIAQAVGISTGLIYYIFPSKEDILLACCEDTATITRDVLNQAREIDDPLQRFDTIVRELYTITDSTSKQLIILYRDISLLQRETRQRILAPMKKLDDYLVALFEEGQRAGRLDHGPGQRVRRSPWDSAPRALRPRLHQHRLRALHRHPRSWRRSAQRPLGR